MTVHPTHDPHLQAQADRDSDLTRHGYTVPHEDRDLSSPSPPGAPGAVAYPEPGGGTPPPPPDPVELAAALRAYAAWLPHMSGLRARLLFAALDVEKGNV